MISGGDAVVKDSQKNLEGELYGYRRKSGSVSRF